MKISYSHPVTKNRTSITVSNTVLRLWGLIQGFDTSSDDFLYDEKVMTHLKEGISDSHKSYLTGSSFPTFVSYFENNILVDVEDFILKTRQGTCT